MIGCREHTQEAERIHRFYEKSAGRYDKQMRFWDRILDFEGGGRLLLLEHVRSPLLPIRAGQCLLQPLTLRFEADHLLRDPADYLAEQGFEIQTLQRSKWGIVERVLARKPAP